MKTIVKNTLISLAFIAPALAAVPTSALAAPAAANIIQVLPAASFVKKQKSIKGDFEVVRENGQTIIRFSDDFKAKKGPDLKVFLSPQTVDAVTGQTATNGAVLLGKLKSTKGTQDYVVPAGVSLSNFSSVLVHCEAYSVLWGGGAL